VTGTHGPATSNALRAFQARVGLPPVGLLDRRTQHALMSLRWPIPWWPPPCAVGRVVGIDAAVEHFKSKVNDCSIVNEGMNHPSIRRDCHATLLWMVQRLRNAGAFPGCRQAKNSVATQLFTGISKQAGDRCCVVQYKSDLAATVAKMRDAIDDGFLIKAGVLSGVCTGTGGACSDAGCCTVRDPDHWLLVFGHDGANQFVFWDPFTEDSDLTVHCRGFGFLFFDPAARRLSTAKDDTEMGTTPGGNHWPLLRDSFDPRCGTCCARFGKPCSAGLRQHRYQVLSVQSL
jgi:hypothetical protein